MRRPHRDSGPARRIGDLAPGERRRALLGAGARTAVAVAAILFLYFTLPIRPAAIDAGAVVTLVAGALLFVVVLWWHFRRIARSTLPQIQAFEAVLVALPLFVTVYASTYLVLSHVQAASFSERLDHISSLYFTVVTLGTVGYGDIVAKTHAARLVVASQVLLDLVVIALLVQVWNSRRSP